jgi:aerotolerance regulator-like protein/VWA domain-containing protein
MSFLSPWFLLAGLAVGVPIWLHLIRREQPTHIPFSSLMFLRRMPVKSVSRQRLKYLLLLATRVLVLLLIALGFARPYFPNAARAFLGGTDRKNLVILLDTSMSMQHGDRWQRALGAARDAIASLGERDRAQIVTFSSEYEIRNLPTSRKAALRAILESGLRPGSSTTSYTQAFRAVDKIAEDLSQPVSVVLISDLQKSAVGNQTQGAPGGAVADFKVADVAGKDAPNWTVAGARSHRAIYRSRYPDRLVAEVRGFNTAAASKEVTLSLEGKTIQRKTVEVPASGAATVVFESFDVPLESNQGEITLSPHDDLPQDDSFHFVLERREPYRLLFLHEPGEGSELYYFRSALGAETDTPFAIDSRTPQESGSARLGDYALVILSNVTSLPQALVASLKDFVREGRGMLVTMGNRFPSPALETDWKEMWPAKGVEKRMLAPGGERMVLLGQFDKDHPLFREFQEAGAAESLRSAETFAYIRVQPEGPVLLRFSNGDPALVERQFGQGRVLLYASSFDNVWGDFPLHPAFIPLLHQLIRYTAQLPDEIPAYTIPASVSLSSYGVAGNQAGSASVWDAISPDGKHALPLDQERRADYLALRQAGFYELRRSNSSHWIAANSDPRESDLTELSPEDRALWMAPGSGNSSGGQNAAMPSDPEVAKRQKIWWDLLLIAFLLALLEAYLANRYLRPRSAGAVSDTIMESGAKGER